MGVLMNTRGIVQLVVLNIGVQLKVISPVIFAMFVLMATILTLMTSPILSFLYKRDPSRKSLEESTVAHDLHLALEGEVDLEKHKENDTVMPDGKEAANGSIKSIMRNREPSNLSNARISFPQIIYPGQESSSANNAGGPPRRYSRMTLF